MNIGIIGCRGHISYVFKGLKQLPEVRIAAIASGSPDPVEPLAGLCRELGQEPPVYSDWRRMLDEAELDLLCVDGPFELHAAMSAAALERGLHVFCEKPIALDFAQLELVRRAWRKSGKHIRSMVGLRYDPAFLHAHRLVRQGAAGKLKFIRTQKSYKLGERPEFYKHRATFGGTIPWVGSHAVDWIIYYSGGARFEKVTALHNAADNRGHGDVEMVGHALFQLSGGLIADAGIDYLRPATAASHGDDRARLAGTDGVLEVIGGRIHLIDVSGDRWIDPDPADRDVFSDFALELTTGRPALTDDAETFQLAEAILLARDSADRGETLTFPGPTEV